jgi:hypothetical protein
VRAQSEELDRRHIGALLRMPWEAANQRVNRAFVAAGYADIHIEDQRVFQQLPPEGATFDELVTRAQATPETMRVLVERMERGGYVARTGDVIARTERGWAVERVAVETLRHIEDAWGEHMGMEQFAELCALLGYLWRAVEANRSEPA